MLRRRLMQSGIPDGFVDLGLPSGILWAKGNIVKNGSTYAIGEETDYGAYFSWGNIDGHNEGEGYNFSSTTYNSTAGKSLTASIASNDAAHDAALACLGSPWHLPTKEHFQELLDNTDREWTTINGVKGYKFMKKTDHSVYVFFPAAGYYSDTSLRNRNTVGDYWPSSYYDDSSAYSFFFSSSNVLTNSSTSRSQGYSVRAIIYDEFVDLGLPSGLLWCTHNIGGFSPEDYGYYFSWGNVDGYEKESGHDFSEEEYEYSNGYYLDDSIPVDSTYDIARKVMGCRLPTENEFEELVNNTDSEWVINYNGTGVAGRKFMKKSDHSVYIFFPASDDEDYGVYWSSTLHSSNSAYSMSFNSSDVYPDNTGGYRYFGRSGRAVV